LRKHAHTHIQYNTIQYNTIQHTSYHIISHHITSFMATYLHLSRHTYISTTLHSPHRPPLPRVVHSPPPNSGAGWRHDRVALVCSASPRRLRHRLAHAADLDPRVHRDCHVCPLTTALACFAGCPLAAPGRQSTPPHRTCFPEAGPGAFRVVLLF
jgi:hypothetical protein